MSPENIELFPQQENLYEIPSVHSDMLQDAERIRTFKRVIERTVKPGGIG